MQTHEQIDGLLSSAGQDSSIDRNFLAKNTMQLKLVEELMRRNNSQDPDHDYEAFLSISKRIGEAIEHIVIDKPEVAQSVLEKATKDPNAPIDPADFAKIEELLESPDYSKYLH